MNFRWNRKAHGLVWAVGAIVVAGLGARVVWVYMWHGVYLPVASTAATVEQRSSAQVLERAGLGADVLAASGVNGEQVNAIVQAAAAEASQRASSLETADTAVRTSRGDVDRLTRIVQAGASSEQQRAELAAARSALSSAQNARDTALAAIFSAGTGVMSPSQARIATAIHANRHWGLAMHHLAADPQSRSEADWVALRDAISCRCACGQCGEDVPEAATAAIAASESITDVAAAKASLTNTLAPVTLAWNNAVSGG